MRTFILIAVLGTMCFAWEESDIHPVLPAIPFDENMWNEAKEAYNDRLMESFSNGTATSPKRPWTKSTEHSKAMDENSNILHFYHDKVAKKHNITKRQASNNQNPSVCTNPSPNCANFANSRYRSVDGTCNNLNNPWWGATNRAFNRLLQPAYEDNTNAPRGGINTRLANPRLISVTVHPDNPNVLNSRITNMVPQFGQFIDHDMTLTPEANGQCCANPGSNINCWAIPVSTNDAFYARFTNCLDFTRSTPCIQNGVRQQMNANTVYIDASQVYGSDATRANALRTFQGGMLKTNPNFAGFVPLATNLGIQSQGDFVAGDNRINEMPGLIVMHNVWIMEHNRIARIFQSISSWSDETIYQETRRIVAAELQNVAYNEYLPLILGPSAISEYNLGVSTWSQYNSQVDATCTNEFATAAYRFGHSLISGIVRLFSASNTEVDNYQVANEYFQSRQVTRNNGQGYDLILRGLMRSNAPEMDRLVTTGVTNFLFKPQTSNFGSDLVARNIQRGRDHGLRSYNDYRTNCGGSDISSYSWGSVPPNIFADGWAQASKVYRTPADIDLFTGALIEIPVAGGLSGPTFTCLKALQFSRAKFGDRYFFTHSLSTGFTANQLTDISKRRLGDIICDNSQQPDTTQNVFLIPSSSNPSIPCGPNSGRPQLNLRNWL